MSARGMYLVGMLVLLFLANIAMLLGMTNWPQRTREGFAESFRSEHMDNINPYAGLSWTGNQLDQASNFNCKGKKAPEAFEDYLIPGTFRTKSIGTYDDIDMAAGLTPDMQGYRVKTPNEPKIYGKYGRKASSMLPFEENQCKPECCSSSMSCDGGGCVCTTPEDRDLINTRGGNRLNRQTHKTGPGYYDEDM